MNNGAFGENFPYSNFHDLNMDWIIKIAKDFLDQYTNIQSTITEGLEGLDTKAQELENLLQQWYDTHSEDIAQELANAVASLNQTLQNAITQFNAQAEQKAQQTIASIPSDYTTLANDVSKLNSLLSMTIHTEGTFDLNDYKTGGAHQFLLGTTVNNVPRYTANPYLLEVTEIGQNNSAYQVLTDLWKRVTFSRYFYGNSQTWTDWMLETTASKRNVSGNGLDFNDFTEPDDYYLSIAQFQNNQNAPLDYDHTPNSYGILTVSVSSSGVITQKLEYCIAGLSFTRTRQLNSTWTDWVQDAVSGYPFIYSTACDLDTFIRQGYYSFNLNATFTNCPQEVVGTPSVYDLKVFKYAPRNVLYQEFADIRSGFKWSRYRDGNGNFQVWRRINTTDITILFTSPHITQITFPNQKLRKTVQDIAVYNSELFEMGEGEMYHNGTRIAIDNGHGNNAMFGKALHGDYPYLYCGSWNYNDCYITVNEVTDTSANMVRKIQFPTLTGHLNMCVDEPNSRIYIIQSIDEDTSIGVCDFIVADLNTGNILSTNRLSYTIPVVQGMEFFDGKIYVVAGGVNGVLNRLYVIGTDGTLIQRSHSINVGEIEGISFAGYGKLWMASTARIFY